MHAAVPRQACSNRRSCAQCIGGCLCKNLAQLNRCRTCRAPALVRMQACSQAEDSHRRWHTFGLRGGCCRPGCCGSCQEAQQDTGTVLAPLPHGHATRGARHPHAQRHVDAQALPQRRQQDGLHVAHRRRHRRVRAAAQVQLRQAGARAGLCVCGLGARPALPPRRGQQQARQRHLPRHGRLSAGVGAVGPQQDAVMQALNARPGAAAVTLPFLLLDRSGGCHSAKYIPYCSFCHLQLTICKDTGQQICRSAS